MKNDDKKFKIKLCMLWIFAFTVIIFLISFRSEAASLPYYVDNENFEWEGFDINDIQSYINQKFINDSAPQYSVDLINNVTLIYQGYENNVPYLAIYTKSNTQNTNYAFGNWSIGIQNFNTETDTVTCSFTKCYRILLKLNANNTLGWKTWYPNQAQSFTLFGSGYYPLYINGLFYDNSNVGGVITQGENVVLTNIADNLIDIGVAILPQAPITPEYLQGLTPPSSVPPTYTINNYSWTTQPSFDNSSTINAIESIKDFMIWLANNIGGEFSNLITNLEGFFGYIGQTIQYYGNIIIQTLNNFIQNFYDNMKSLVEPIFNELKDLKEDFVEFADLFIHPFDEEEFETQIDSCALINQYEELMENCDTIQQILIDAEEKDSFILYIDFENPFADSEHKIIASEINFNWLVPLRPTYRPFLWVFTMLECFIGGFRLLGNIIGGKSK